MFLDRAVSSSKRDVERFQLSLPSFVRSHAVERLSRPIVQPRRNGVELSLAQVAEVGAPGQASAQQTAFQSAGSRSGSEDRPMIWVLLDALRFGMLEIDGDWRVVYANATAMQVLRDADALSTANGRIEFRRRKDRERAAEWLRHSAAERESVPLVLPRLSGRLSYVIHRITAEARETPAELRHALLLIDPERSSPVEPGVLVEVFGLTRAEASLAAALAVGASVQELAARAGIAEGTVRRHLERIFLKTGSERQVDLVRKVLACAAPLS